MNPLTLLAILFSAAPSLRDEENIVGFSFIDQKDMSEYVTDLSLRKK
jgi:hypothetical protein